MYLKETGTCKVRVRDSEDQAMRARAIIIQIKIDDSYYNDVLLVRHNIKTWSKISKIEKNIINLIIILINLFN